VCAMLVSQEQTEDPAQIAFRESTRMNQEMRRAVIVLKGNIQTSLRQTDAHCVQKGNIQISLRAHLTSVNRVLASPRAHQAAASLQTVFVKWGGAVQTDYHVLNVRAAHTSPKKEIPRVQSVHISRTL